VKRAGMPARMQPMRRTASSLRCSGLNPVSKKRAAANRERTKALRPLREAQTWCTRCGVSGVGLDAHELLSRARGGSITDLDNIVLLCRSCHDLITTSPALAEAEGWSRTAGAV
jgi:5-methylcytosine-specific restriction endonuclease McrA